MQRKSLIKTIFKYQKINFASIKKPKAIVNKKKKSNLSSHPYIT